MTERENNDPEISKESKEENLPYSLVEVKPVFDGYLFFFRNQAEAEQAIKDFWAKIWSKTPDMFARGMWKPHQTLTGGADYRTRLILQGQITEEQRQVGITTGFFIGGNEQQTSQKGINALKELGLLKE